MEQGSAIRPGREEPGCVEFADVRSGRRRRLARQEVPEGGAGRAEQSRAPLDWENVAEQRLRFRATASRANHPPASPDPRFLDPPRLFNLRAASAKGHEGARRSLRAHEEPELRLSVALRLAPVSGSWIDRESKKIKGWRSPEWSGHVISGCGEEPLLLYAPAALPRVHRSPAAPLGPIPPIPDLRERCVTRRSSMRKSAAHGAVRDAEGKGHGDRRNPGARWWEDGVVVVVVALRLRGPPPKETRDPYSGGQQRVERRARRGHSADWARRGDHKDAESRCRKEDRKKGGKEGRRGVLKESRPGGETSGRFGPGQRLLITLLAINVVKGRGRGTDKLRMVDGSGVTSLLSLPQPSPAQLRARRSKRQTYFPLCLSETLLL